MPNARYIICNYDILTGARRRNASGVLGDVDDLPGWQNTLVGRFLIATVNGTNTDFVLDNVVAVPEPATAAVVGLGAVGLLLRRRKRA